MKSFGWPPWAWGFGPDIYCHGSSFSLHSLVLGKWKAMKGEKQSCEQHGVVEAISRQLLFCIASAGRVEYSACISRNRANVLCRLTGTRRPDPVVFYVLRGKSMFTLCVKFRQTRFRPVQSERQSRVSRWDIFPPQAVCCSSGGQVFIDPVLARFDSFRSAFTGLAKLQTSFIAFRHP